MRGKWQIWIGVGLVCGFIYLTRGILLPFVAGLAVAYLLDPLADKLEAVRFPRWLATVTILSLFFLGATGLVLGLLPIFQDQILGFVENLPRYIAALRPLIDETLARLDESFHVGADTDSIVAAMTDQGLERLGKFASGVISRGAAMFNLLTLLLISPVVAFFMLRDWDLLVARIDSWLPPKQAPLVRLLARRIDNALAGFVRGQTMVSLIMALLYGLGWTLVGLDYGLVLGLLAGVLAYVPVVGAFFAMLTALLVGFGQYGADTALLWIVGVWAVVQAIEGSVLTPRLIGSHIGLHPVWVLFAIFAGAEVMGFVGVLIALPVAAAIGVVAKYLIEQYLEQGPAPEAQAVGDDPAGA